MQTFLPYADFYRSAEVIDRARLWKQCVEIKQLVISHHEQTAHTNHPASKMWVGYTGALASYGIVCCDIVKRIHNTYSDSVKEWLKEYVESELILPPWFGSYKFHSAHRSNLKRKEPRLYHFKEPDNWEYFWPASNYDWRDNPLDIFDPQSR